MEDGDSAPTSTFIDGTTKQGKQDDRIRRAKDKELKQFEFIESCTIADVVIDASTPLQLKGYGSNVTTSLQSIKGVCPNLLGHNTARHFMIKNKMQNYRGKSKRELLGLIVEAKKNEGIDELMYSEDFVATGGGEEVVDASDDDAEEEGIPGGDTTSKKRRKRLPKLTKGTKPREITQEIFSVSGKSHSCWYHIYS